MPIAIRDVTADYQSLMERRQSVTAALLSELGRLAKEQPSLIAAVVRLLNTDGSVHSPFRLLPFPLLGALTSQQDQALFVVMCSRLWWTGAEVFDDLTDGEFDTPEVGLSAAQAAVASTACLGPLPQILIEHSCFPEDVRTAWAREFAVGSLNAAEGQLKDLTDGLHDAAWANTMRIYASKSGAPYGRDAAMTAVLAGAETDAVSGWRIFGRLFGVLRQMVNDRAAASAEENKDLANGTMTLLVALASDTAQGAEAQFLKELRVRALEDVRGRNELWRFLTRPNLTIAYDQRVRLIHRKLSELLHTLTDASGNRDLIQWMVNISAQNALIAGEAGVA